MYDFSIELLIDSTPHDRYHHCDVATITVQCNGTKKHNKNKNKTR